MKSPKLPQPESMADFKHRIALLMRNKEGGKIYSIIGAAPSDPCVIREKKVVDNAKQHGILKP
jgi:hypothetical protein